MVGPQPLHLEYYQHPPDQHVTTKTQASAPTKSRVAELDGVRGIAILLTIVCNTAILQHATMPWATAWQRAADGCWIGVQLFFILSGFLITSILLDSRGEQRFFINFYARRALRIVPIYYLVIAGIVAFFFIMGSRTQHNPLCYWLFMSNVCIAKTGYWGEFVGVTWSLAVEEHFYIVWPFLVAAFVGRRLAIVTAAIIAASLMLRFALSMKGVSSIVIYTITPTRIDGLAAGALIAMAIRSSVSSATLVAAARTMLGVGLAIILWVVIKTGAFAYDNRLAETIGYVATTVAGSGLVLLMVTGPHTHPLLGRAMRWPLLMNIGFYSYAIYLFHPIAHGILTRTPMFHADNLTSFPGGPLAAQIVITALVIAISWSAAILSYSLIEKRFLALRRLFPRNAEVKFKANQPVEQAPVSVPA
jgi:peptidoglycan/LPS O-acetylase OafA/YrhL